MKKIWLSVLAVTALSLSSASEVVAATTPLHSSAQIYNCLTKSAHPSEIVLTCADGNRLLRHITWRHWGAAVATASATLEWDSCTPTCLTGKLRSRHITFTATDLHLVKGAWLYEHLVATGQDWNTKSSTWVLPIGPVGY